MRYDDGGNTHSIDQSGCQESQSAKGRIEKDESGMKELVACAFSSLVAGRDKVEERTRIQERTQESFHQGGKEVSA